ncbi:MAG: helix-turn-helix transcriptional regulator [Pseudonocardia sp.]
MDRIPICVCAHDPVSHAGVVSQLRPRPEVEIVDRDDDRTRVAIVAADAVDAETLTLLQQPAARRVSGRPGGHSRGRRRAGRRCGGGRRRSRPPGRGDTRAAGACGRGCGARRGNGSPDLLGRLLAQVGRVQQQFLAPRGLNLTGLSTREADILRLLADGLDTNEIAVSLSCSERTVKNVLHDVTNPPDFRGGARYPRPDGSTGPVQRCEPAPGTIMTMWCVDTIIRDRIGQVVVVPQAPRARPAGVPFVLPNACDGRRS